MKTQDERLTLAGGALDLAILNWEQLKKLPELRRFLLDLPEILGVSQCYPSSQQPSS